MNSVTVPLSVIKFSELEKCITSFKLKAVSYTSNEAGGMQFIVIMRNTYSIKRSNTRLKRFLSTMKESTNNLNDSFCNYFHVIKNDNIFEEYLASRIFGTKNVETNEIYDVTGKAFGSLFDKEWLHCDIIDTYLNEWRRRMGEIICNSSNMDKIRIKIYNTLLYTRLTRGVKITSLKPIPKKTYMRIQDNASRIANEKVYHFSKICGSIFDFDVLIIPIHIDDHWITGVIHRPQNCLVEIKKFDDDSMEVDDDIHSSVFVFDSLATDFTVNKHVCTAVLKEYVEACYKSLKEKFLGKDWHFNKDKIRTIKIQTPYQQRNGYDCGLFMLEFIRQIMINPNSLEKLVKGEPMTNVFPKFSVSLSRNYLKLFVYSKVDLQKWIILREMEEYFLNDGSKKKLTGRRSKSVEPKKSIGIESKFKWIKNFSYS
ncbi:Peptidase C48, SUMO/Sentrin/Ubl1 family-containing protein [Strongyloides ratti]|uniref:Peptidase C48, SUMO/Sentrin/Ubl1 family-containing protein n=1 Tax=Strongyloides ratti TaxID=34506 RepID=A0A090L145_STRRB|nr:Peptidase C48, SUMO/Sentrin/Ubl1 family-containing protein [Strongyloides ratti]CEF61832.1 Peptidase C48, SUMO/Sentrin/Ubl1 family-containing protein [Strongyloides ratti]